MSMPDYFGEKLFIRHRMFKELLWTYNVIVYDIFGIVVK